MKTNLIEVQTKIQNAMTGGCAGIKATIAGERIQLNNGSKVIGFVSLSDAGVCFSFESFGLLKRAITAAFN
jgi:hypothetical protein